VKRNLKLPWIALLLYATSFFLPSIQVLGAGLPGWFAQDLPWHQLEDMTIPFQTQCFWSSAANAMCEPFLAPPKNHERWRALCDWVLLVMVPCSWIVFYFLVFRQRYSIREGYVFS